MTKNKNDELFERIISESCGYKKTLDELQRVIDSTQKFQGLTLIGGVKAILKALHDEQEKSSQLKRELYIIKQK